MELQAWFKAYLKEFTPYKANWNYEDGCVLMGSIRMYEATGDTEYRDFVLRYLDGRVTPEGGVPSFGVDSFNIDSINSGKALFFALEQTGEERYRKAIEFVMSRLREHPRCKCGSFWHKTIYPNQIWLDGLYMAQPFYMQYERDFDGLKNVGDIMKQFDNVRAMLYAPDKHLFYHACDEARVQPWCDKQTGCSPNFWLRSMGWYLMALADCAELCPETLYDSRRKLMDMLREALKGMLEYRDAKTGLFYQVIDRPDEPGNYIETSGSAMIACALMKAARIGAMLKEKYAPVGLAIFNDIVEQKLRMQDGQVRLCDICQMAGLGPGDKRDGSVAYYLSEPIIANDSKGVGPLMMAAAEMLLQKNGAK